ncbi:MAG: zonular occludens toxin domain-containing protein [Thiothrix sp.]|uniref:zonular occludens toxin family protein n=1 Tax=Thiothrix sp. TaxID=1032 RepID=UPI002603A41D|nr:zonular occludens toxin domain-containing protein [Thiothrix sp.]MDD5392819.1 zonular occludens toxin domain-containing protein [Thiothrix sp.]
MSIKIHHGFPGSYKTSGAVQDDFVPAVLEGRHVITNVRGLDSEDNIRDVLEGQGLKVPESFRLTWLDTSSSETMDMVRKWFHWVPNGAFLLLDEIQEIYPRSMRESALNKFNFPNGLDAATQAGTFETLALAFEKHRHKNLDFVVTTPHIQKVHPVVRGAAEGGYKHKNLAVLGSFFKGRYIEGFHPVDTNGRPSDFYSVTRKSIKPYVFKLYKSTATGKATDTTAGSSLLKNGKVLGLLLLLLLLFVVLAVVPAPDFVKSQSASSVPVSSPLVPPSAPLAAAPNPANGYKNSGLAVHNSLGGLSAPLPPRLAFLQWSDIEFRGWGNWFGQQTYEIRFTSPSGNYVDVKENNAARFGLAVVVYDRCAASIYYSGREVAAAFCKPSQVPKEAPQPLQNPAELTVTAGLEGANQMANPFAAKP